MKKCPTCDKSFDDGMRFCQTDGTPLVEVSEDASPDPYKTVVSNQNDISAPPVDPFKTTVGVPPVNKEEDDISQNRMREEANNPPLSSSFGDAPPTDNAAKDNFEASYNVPSETPKFNEPSLNAPDFGDLSSADKSSMSEESNLVFNRSTEDIPPKIDSSPFSEGAYNQSNFENPPNQAASTPFDAPSSSGYQPPFKEPEQPFNSQRDPFNQSAFEKSQTPFGQQSSPYNAPLQETEWAPPPAPVSNWQDQGLGANTPFQPPLVGAENKTLAIISLVCGILSMLCCMWFLPGIIAVVLGIIAKNKADQNPAEYGGRGMALAGIITGGISIAFGIIVSILWFLGAFVGRF